MDAVATNKEELLLRNASGKGLVLRSHHFFLLLILLAVMPSVMIHPTLRHYPLLDEESFLVGLNNITAVNCV